MRSILALAVLLPFGSVVTAQDPAQPGAQPVKAEKADKDKEPAVLSLGKRANGNTVLLDIDGKEHKAKSYQGKITVVNFYSIECPIQAAWDNRLAAIQKEFAAKDVVFLNIDSNRTEIGDAPAQPKEGEKPYANIRDHLKAKDLPYTVLVDHGNVVADAFGAKTTPDVFVFGKDGKLVYRGLVDDDPRGEMGDKAKRYLRDTLTKLVAGEKVEAFETKPQGCTIKRMPKPKAAPAAATSGK